jgi:tetratricopeptide (TPR) repeat protein
VITIDECTYNLKFEEGFCLRFRHWQRNALGKLEAREKLKSSGTIVLKIKIARTLLSKDSKENVPTSLEISNKASGAELASAIGRLVNVEGTSLKLISSGKVLREESNISSDLGLKPGSVVMAVRIDRSDDQWKVINEQRKILQDTRNDADILGRRDDDGGLEISDQTGKRMEMPNEERKALIMAMSFHEKGRASLKKNNFELALVLLLEAIDEYHNCHSDLLKRVDNYALLNLDVAWCYLKLGNMSELPNAAALLMECETNFVNSYGANLERVVALKGTADNEKVLYMRMHLLQGIVAFHQGHKRRAVDLLVRAETELTSLDVSEDSLDEVVALGYSGKEARLALRAECGNVASAVKYAEKKREQRQKIAKEEAERKRKRREYGKTVNGNWVNLGYVSTLEKMGFPEMYCVAALRQTENDINAAVDAIQNQPGRR